MRNALLAGALFVLAAGCDPVSSASPDAAPVTDDGGPETDASELDGAVEWDGAVESDGGPIESDGGPIEPDGGPSELDGGADGGPSEPDGGPVCGDGAIQGAELCDGAALGGATCESLGYARGALACDATCRRDASACVAAVCGDGASEGSEPCDGTDLRGATCASIGGGFLGGILACSTTCGLDTAGCTATPRPSAVGQILVTELMPNPSAFSDDDGEWIEVHNTTSAPLDLVGCEIFGTSSAVDGFTVTRSVVIAAGAYATFAPTTTVAGAPGFAPTYRFPRSYFQLHNASDDGVTIRCGGVDVDTVTYTPAFTFGDGVSAQLDPSQRTALGNDSASSWCPATSTFAPPAELGTPNAANASCPRCGDGAIDALEDCDGLQLGTASCTSVGGGFSGGTLACTATCDYDTRACTLPPRCGDGARNGTEVCEGGDLGGATCATVPGYVAGTLACTSTCTLDTRGCARPGLMFTEYVEGAGADNKALEVFNAGSTTINLYSCEIDFYMNGSPTSTAGAVVDLIGSLAPSATYTICTSTLVAPSGARCDLRVPLSFNGDDGIGLWCGGRLVDSIGRFGTDPGTAWGVAPDATVNTTLRRACGAPPDVNEDDDFVPIGSGWSGVGADVLSGLGTRTCPASP